MARTVAVTPGLRLEAQVTSNICCFDASPANATDDEREAINAGIAKALQLSGDAVFSTTRLNGRTLLRAAIANHRTTRTDVFEALQAVTRVRDGVIAQQASGGS